MNPSSTQPLPEQNKNATPGAAPGQQTEEQKKAAADKLAQNTNSKS